MTSDIASRRSILPAFRDSISAFSILWAVSSCNRAAATTGCAVAICLATMRCIQPSEDQQRDHDHHQRRHRDLLQGLGHGAADRVQPWLAAFRRCVRGPDVLPGHRGYRCIAHDRRGHGRSSQPWHGNDLDTYADDLAALVADARPQAGDPCRPFDRRRRSGPLYRAPRHRPRGQGRADRRDPAADAEDAGQSGRHCRSRYSTGSAPERRRRTGRSSGRISACRSTATIGRVPRYRKGCASRSGCRA